MIERIALTALVNALWLQLAVAALAWVMLRCLRSASASTRYGVLAVALLASFVLPIVVALARVHIGAAPPASPTAFAPRTQTVQAVKYRALPAVTHTAAAPRPHIAAPPHMGLTIPPIAARLLLLLWLPIVAALLLRVAISIAHLERLKRNALPLPMACRERLLHLQWPDADRVRLCVSDETLVPIAIGWFDAMVLIPKHLTDTLDADDLVRIIQHELAHLQRHDAVALLLQHVGGALFFFSPGLAWIAHQMDLEREIACDDWVVSDSVEATRYATCLIRLAENTPWPHRAAFAPGAFVTRRSMSIRVERILQRTHAIGLRAARGPLAATLLVMATAGVAAAAVAPSIAFSGSPLAHMVKRSVAPIERATPKPATKPLKTVTTRVSYAHNVSIAHPVHVATHVGVTEHVAARAPVQHAPQVTAPVVVANASDGDYIDAMQTVFGEHLTVDQLVALKSMGVTPDDVTRWHQAGFPAIRVNEVIEARSVRLTPARLSALRSTFGGDLSFEQAVAMQSLNVDAQYVAEMKAAGLQNIRPEQLLALKSVGVTRDYIAHVDAMGFGTLNANQIVELKSLGIDSDYIQRVRSHGFTNLRLEQLIELKTSGVIQ